jgi:hypothetical protein
MVVGEGRQAHYVLDLLIEWLWGADRVGVAALGYQWVPETSSISLLCADQQHTASGTISSLGVLQPATFRVLQPGKHI